MSLGSVQGATVRRTNGHPVQLDVGLIRTSARDGSDTRYGALNNNQFVTQLYANVLRRSPDLGGLSYHVTRLNAGVARADVLVGSSELPEHQVNLIGRIGDVMLFIRHF